MIFMKIIFHLCALFLKLVYKLIYGGKIKFGKSVTWRKSMSIMIDHNASVSIGDNCFFNNNCSINSNNAVVIGDNCLFGEGVKIYDHDHKFSKKNMLIKEQGFSVGKVVIGDNCWIGSNVVILRDSYIGDNCVVGAGCIIKGNVPNNTIVRGNINNEYEKII